MDRDRSRGEGRRKRRDMGMFIRVQGGCGDGLRGCIFKAGQAIVDLYLSRLETIETGGDESLDTVEVG